MTKVTVFKKNNEITELVCDGHTFYGEKGEISWGNQIRSYVFQPYQLVKDLRTGAETGNLQAVIDGDLDMFINAWLRAGGPTARNKNYLSSDEE